VSSVSYPKRKGAYALFKKRFKVALRCMAIRTQTELMIRRVQFIRRTKEAATQADSSSEPVTDEEDEF